MGENRNGSKKELVPPTITSHMCFLLKNKCQQGEKVFHASDIYFHPFTAHGSNTTVEPIC